MYALKYSRGQINCIGHYSEEGEKLRKLIFPANYTETEMFWIINRNRAYGGRSGLLPLLVLIIKGMFKPKGSPNWVSPEYCFNSQMCKDRKFKIRRLYNLFRNGKKLSFKFTKSING
jgi:hypothetical protein